MAEIGFLRKEDGFSLRDTVRSSAVREGLKGRPRTETPGWPGNAPVFPRINWRRWLGKEGGLGVLLKAAAPATCLPEKRKIGG